MLSPWRFVTVFGTISLLADFVYEGARSITGPLLASLGATAFVVGVVTGVGEAGALLLRLVSGPLTDRLRADETVFNAMVDGWRAPMLARGLATDTTATGAICTM